MLPNNVSGLTLSVLTLQSKIPSGVEVSIANIPVGKQDVVQFRTPDGRVLLFEGYARLHPTAKKPSQVEYKNGEWLNLALQTLIPGTPRATVPTPAEVKVQTQPVTVRVLTKEHPAPQSQKSAPVQANKPQETLESFYQKATGLPPMPLTQKRLDKIQEALKSWGLQLNQVKLEKHNSPQWNIAQMRTALEKKAIRIGSSDNTKGSADIFWLIPLDFPQKG